MKRYSFCTTILILLISCTDKNATEPTGEYDFALYFLADDTLATYEAMQQGIAELELLGEPWLSDDDIRFYDFSSHYIYLKTDKGDFFEGYNDDSPIEYLLIDKPFVVVAGDSRCYIGSLHDPLLAFFPPGPYIDIAEAWFTPEDVMHISRDWVAEEDVRSMDQISETLTALDLFHGGLDLSLDAVSVIENAAVSTIQYTFGITNQDSDDLLILDPDRMGSDRFHYFINGIVFWGEATRFLESENKEVIAPDPFDSWQSEWFSKIGAGESLQRTVQLRGYPRIPAGSYDCSLRFANPTKIALVDRHSSGARYWLGEITSDEIVVVVN